MLILIQIMLQLAIIIYCSLGLMLKNHNFVTLQLILNEKVMVIIIFFFQEQVSDKDRDIAHLTSIVEMKDRQKAELEVNYVMQSQLYSYYTFDTYVRFSNFPLSVISLLRTEKLKTLERL